MGNSCCNQNRHNHHQTNGHRQAKAAYHTSGDRSVHRRPASSVAPSGNGSGTEEGILLMPKKVQIEHTEDECIAPVTTTVSANQVEEPQILKSNESKIASLDCKVEDEDDDVCKESYRSDLLLKIDDEGDFCPTCLEGYDEENPMILTKCKHHYHLACILEWMERSNTCPMCDKQMEFEETS